MKNESTILTFFDALQDGGGADAATAAAIEANLLTANNIWMMLATALVFIMHLGFAGVEAGFGQAKNTVNILFKNTLTPIIGLLSYAGLGFFLMYPGFAEGSSGWFAFDSAGWSMFWGSPEDADVSAGYAGAGYTYWTDFLFQGMFAATAATIVSGAVAERIKLSSYLIFTVIFVGIVYPLIGSWKWGGGALDMMGFYDFAGSTLVHSVGGWGALAGVIVLGPRLGKYVDGKVIDKPGSSVPLAVIGVFLLWLGWFGFNGGSELKVSEVSSATAVSQVFLNTNMAAAGGVVAALMLSLFRTGKMDVTMAINGAIAGLVSITADPLSSSAGSAVLVGAIGGAIVYFSILFLEKRGIDDPVGAISAHGIVGIYGVLIVTLTGGADFVGQLTGVVLIATFTYATSFAAIYLINMLLPIRATDEEQFEGLDVSEIGVEAYPEFK